MPIDMTSNPDDSPMFAPIPSWERNRKRRGFGASRAARVTATPQTLDESPAADPLDPLAPDAPLVGEGAFAGQPVYATRAAPRRSGVPAMAITAGLVAVIGLAAAGWYASQPHDSGMAELTPGSSAATTTVAPSQVALNEAAARPVATTHVSSADRPPAVTSRRSTTTTSTPTARARPPASRSVDDAGVNASATLPAGPQPYSGTAVNPTPAPAAAAPTPAPAQSAPAPVEATPAPAPVSPVAPPAADTTPSVTPQ